MPKHFQDQSGFLLIFLLGSIVLIGIAVSVAAEKWSMVARRAKEDELLYRGMEIRTAIWRYSSGVPGATQYPEKLDDLLKDPRSLKTIRYLRRITKDPITGEDWGLIYAANGRVMGVRSESTEEPIKKDGFPPDFSDFKDAKKYCKWVFKFIPGQPAHVPTAGSKGTSLFTGSTSDEECP